MAATQKPHQASPKGKGFKRNESQESAHAARQRKRDAKRKGLKAGSRQAAAAEKGAANSAGQKKDPRIGSRKPVPLVVAESQKKAVSKPAKPNKSPEHLAKHQHLKLEQELAAIENDERLNLLLDRLDDGQSVSAEDEAWLDTKLARHQELLAELGIDDEEDEEEQAASPDDLLQRFIEDDFDPSEIDPEFKRSKK